MEAPEPCHCGNCFSCGFAVPEWRAERDKKNSEKFKEYWESLFLSFPEGIEWKKQSEILRQQKIKIDLMVQEKYMAENMDRRNARLKKITCREIDKSEYTPNESDKELTDIFTKRN